MDMINKISTALEKVDVLVTTGSVSMGDRDLLKPILETIFKATIHFGTFFFNHLYVNTCFLYKVKICFFFRTRKYEAWKTNNICNVHNLRQKKIYSVPARKSSVCSCYCTFIPLTPCK